MERCLSGTSAATSRTAKNKSAPAATPMLRDPRIECLRIRLLFERIDGQSAEQLGIEVGGFLGHDLASEGNITDLRDAARIHQESDVRARAGCAAHLRQGLSGVANVGDVLLIAEGFF